MKTGSYGIRIDIQLRWHKVDIYAMYIQKTDKNTKGSHKIVKGLIQLESFYLR
jgi:hypothetical protein